MKEHKISHEDQRSMDTQMVLDALRCGQENSVSMKHLRQLTGLTRRRITETIRELRTNHPICSTNISPGGYWLGNDHDIKRMVCNLNATAYTYLQTAEKLKKHLSTERERNAF